MGLSRRRKVDSPRLGAERSGGAGTPTTYREARAESATVGRNQDLAIQLRSLL